MSKDAFATKLRTNYMIERVEEKERELKLSFNTMVKDLELDALIRDWELISLSETEIREVKPVKDESCSTSKSVVLDKGVTSSNARPKPSTRLVTEDESRAFPLQKGLVTKHDIVFKFKGRLKSTESKDAFATKLRTNYMIERVEEKERELKLSFNTMVKDLELDALIRDWELISLSETEIREVKPVKDESCSTSKSVVLDKGVTSSIARPKPSTRLVTEDESWAFPLRKGLVTKHDNVFKFKGRLKSTESKDAFATKLRTNTMIQKTDGAKYIMLRGRTRPTSSTGPVTEDELRAFLLQKSPVTMLDVVTKFKSRMKSKENKDAFVTILRRTTRLQKTDGAKYVILRP